MSLVVDIEKHYGTFDLEVAFEAAHETLGFLGASGCGKSLTLRCIAGVETPDAGKIVVNGKTYFDKAPGKKASVNLSAQQRKSALLFQNYQLFPNLTVKANIAAGIPREVLKREGDALIERQLTRFGLRGLENATPCSFPVVSSNAWRSRACSPPSLRSSCSTNRSLHSMRT